MTIALVRYPEISHWSRPAEDKFRVGLQAGHLGVEEHPEELERLRNNTGSKGGGKWEWEVNLEIAERSAAILESRNINVDILPATVPPGYWADIFIAIHADGSEDPQNSGFKVAPSWHDLSGKAPELVRILTEEYQQKTGMTIDENITHNMRGYYAFSWWRYEHAVHPMTTSAIIETGFLTNAGDRKIIVDNPQIAAEAISSAVFSFLGI